MHSLWAIPINVPIGVPPIKIVSSRIDDDAFPDLVTLNGETGDVSILFGAAGLEFTRQRRFSVGLNPYSLAVADIDGNGTNDVVTANGGTNDISILLGDGTGNFSPQFRMPWGANPVDSLPVDLDMDGKLDLITITMPGNSGTSNLSTLLQSPEIADGKSFGVRDRNGIH